MIYCGQPTIGLKEREYVTQVLDSGQFTAGPWVRRFGEALSEVVGGTAIPVSSGTAALHLALAACGVGKGDEVIIPATTFVATLNAVLYCGATPVVVDVENPHWTLGDVYRFITRRTKAIVPVHLYGVPASVPSMADHYRRTGRRIYVVEDCAEALGATSSGRPVGSLGDVAALSFYGSKTITTGGEGGAVVTKCPLIERRVRHLAGQAQTARYQHDTVGYNYRMTEIQAAFGVAQLESLEENLAKRRQVFDWYNQALPARYRRQQTWKDDQHGYWAFAVLDERHRDAQVVARRMAQVGVETRPIFPPVNSFPYVSSIGPPPFARRLNEYGLVLPTHAALTRDDVQRVCVALQEAGQ